MSPTVPDRGRATLVGELALRLANQLLGSCAQRGVELMPLKGVLMLSRWPSLRGRRDLVDIDFLVRSSDMEQASFVLGALGFEATVHTSAGSTFASDAWPLSVDIHRRLFPHDLFCMSTEGVFLRSQRDTSLFAAPVARMSDEDLFAHLIGHFVKGRGTFREDTSLDDIRWLWEQGLFGVEEAGVVGAHLRELGLQRAAGYVLGDESFRNEPLANALLRGLQLSWRDRTTIVVARLGTKANAGSPPWWTPHLLDRSLVAGSHSLFAHADEARRRVTLNFMERWKSKSHTSSVTRATR